MQVAIDGGLSAESLLKGGDIMDSVENPKGDDDSDFASDDGAIGAQQFASRRFMRPVTSKQAMAIAKRIDDEKKMKEKKKSADEKEAADKRRKRRRDAGATGAAALATLKAAGAGWEPVFKQMKMTELDGLAVSLALEEKFQGNKETKQGLLLPHVRSWYDDQPRTRTSTTDE